MVSNYESSLVLSRTPTTNSRVHQRDCKREFAPCAKIILLEELICVRLRDD